MIGLDTNVLVRYLTQDDVKQAAIATRLIERELSTAQPGFVSLVVLVEVCWVLQRLYAATQSEVLATVEDLLQSAQFVIEQRQAVQATTQQMRSRAGVKVGFTDVLIVEIGKTQGCVQTLSFDKGAVRSAGMTLLT
ncbi:type II toxin-antitoxin system VapC family toxin [Rhodoferax sp.]|uniref:PIN domain-containing protein n=1 Tax=Rhodoferax sp. TaxID=50421 RepID=UPI00261F9881|nr:type II toxin-antitoxin system VapC family toxin [Rhodoferax sp.]MDD2808074.1 type II toxin-antitoxin system VapC family toxin [Rhodoferax sp.]